MRRAVSRFVKAHPRLARFRVGERVLVRWAYEDLELEEGGYGMGGVGSGADGEEDVMVSGKDVAALLDRSTVQTILRAGQ